jgi:hypothetical protein
MPRSCDSPAPIRSPTTTSPVAIPIRTCRGEPAAVESFGIRLDQVKPGADGALGADLTTRAGGFVAKYMGDGVLAYFGYPQAHENDDRRG